MARTSFLLFGLMPLVFVGVFFILDGYISRGFIFDPKVLHQAAKTAIGDGNRTMGEIVSSIQKDLLAAYPGHINANEQWIFNIAGGAMGQMYLLHASLTEYVIIFGTPIGTDGFSGRFFADDYFMILQGEQWAYYEGHFEREVYQAGDLHILPRGSAQGYRMPAGCFALEYARGWIPLMLPFGIADTLTSTLDVPTLVKTVTLYGKLVVNELLQGKF
eukprot:TRINITY_DN2247_c0_g1_i1.p1 TRINITY_DN2247_c0_g1~~TRINITY_DN2247_c0_g1_i1.p1  ORF type:complete len:226 (+),score=18.01 TRINITY_DN2247_c0_g1_i1:29-679(+)